MMRLHRAHPSHQDRLILTLSSMFTVSNLFGAWQRGLIGHLRSYPTPHSRRRRGRHHFFRGAHGVGGSGSTAWVSRHSIAREPPSVDHQVIFQRSHSGPSPMTMGIPTHPLMVPLTKGTHGYAGTGTCVYGCGSALQYPGVDLCRSLSMMWQPATMWWRPLPPWCGCHHYPTLTHNIYSLYCSFYRKVVVCTGKV